VSAWLLLFGSRFAGTAMEVLLSCSVSVLCVFVESGCVLFRFLLAFELTGCCAFLCWVVLLLVRLSARLHSVVDGGVGFSCMCYFCFEVQVVGRVARV